MSVLTDVLMEALDNKEITPAEAAVMMRQYYTEGMIRDAFNNAYRVMDTSRKDRGAVKQQLKANSALKDAERNVKKQCALAYKTMLKYSRLIGIKDNENGVDDMQSVIGAIQSALKLYHNAQRVAEKSDKSQIDAVANKVIANLNTAKRCFAKDGTPDRDELKTLAANTRLEYHNIDASDVDPKAPNSKKKNNTKKPVKESVNDDFFSEGFLSDMKAKISKKNDSSSSKDSNSTSKSSKKPTKKDDVVDRAISNCMSIRTGASGAMMMKIRALNHQKDYNSSDDIKDANRALNSFMGTIHSAIDKVKAIASGKSSVAPLTKVADCIKKAINSTNPKEIDDYRISMMDQKLVVSESYQFEAVNPFNYAPTSDALGFLESQVNQYNYHASLFRQHMSAGNKKEAAKDLKELKKVLGSMKAALVRARDNTGIVISSAWNVLYYSVIIIFISVGIFFTQFYPAIGVAYASLGGFMGGYVNMKSTMNVIDAYKETGKINPAAFNAALVEVNYYIDDITKKISRMEAELAKA